MNWYKQAFVVLALLVCIGVVGLLENPDDYNNSQVVDMQIMSIIKDKDTGLETVTLGFRGEQYGVYEKDTVYSVGEFVPVEISRRGLKILTPVIEKGGEN